MESSPWSTMSLLLYYFFGYLAHSRHSLCLSLSISPHTHPATHTHKLTITLYTYALPVSYRSSHDHTCSRTRVLKRSGSCHMYASLLCDSLFIKPAWQQSGVQTRVKVQPGEFESPKYSTDTQAATSRSGSKGYGDTSLFFRRSSMLNRLPWGRNSRNFTNEDGF